MNSNMACKICKNTEGNQAFTVREMMYGTKDEFEYFECRSCGCLQILVIPESLAKYYPEDFYAFQQHPREIYKVPSWARFHLRRSRAKYLLSRKGLLGKIILRSTGDYFGNTYDWSWLQKTDAGLGSSILDVGCGAGKLLQAMEENGFSDLTGVDPYIEQDVSYGPINIYKKTLDQVEGTFDLIMLHHSFEHMPDPLSTLKQINKLLKPMCSALIRIPLAGSYAWKKYGIHWVQLDAPRHFFLHTPKSISILAKLCGFDLTEVVFDSTAFQFMGSEQYLKGIPLRSQKSYVSGLGGSIFTADDVAKFEQSSDDLNKSSEGDQACFYLKKTSDLT